MSPPNQLGIVNTTGSPNTTAPPTNNRLLNKSRLHLLRAAEDNGMRLRQSDNHVAPRLAAQIARYAHAKQVQAHAQTVRVLRTRVSRVHREFARQLHFRPEADKAEVQDLLQRTGHI